MVHQQATIFTEAITVWWVIVLNYIVKSQAGKCCAKYHKGGKAVILASGEWCHLFSPHSGFKNAVLKGFQMSFCVAATSSVCRNNQGHELALAGSTYRWTSQKKCIRCLWWVERKGNPADLLKSRRRSCPTRNHHQSERELEGSNRIHTSACGLAQHPCAKPSKINTQLFHHRPRFTAQSIMAIVVLGNAVAINHSPRSTKVRREEAPAD